VAYLVIRQTDTQVNHYDSHYRQSLAIQFFDDFGNICRSISKSSDCWTTATLKSPFALLDIFMVVVIGAIVCFRLLMVVVCLIEPSNPFCNS
jgi:hypothetical protein